MLAHTIESSLESKIFSHVVVSTEDKEVAKIAERFGADVPFMRPKRLAADCIATADVIYHGIIKLQSLGYDFETVVNRDCTVPFIRSQDIKKTVRLLKKTKCDAVAGVYRQHLNPYYNMIEKTPSGFVKISKALKERPKSRQTAPAVYQLNGLFTYDVKRFLKFKIQLPPKTIPLEILPETGIMIDTELEFKFAEFIMQNNY